MTCYRAIVLVSIFCCICSASQTVWAQGQAALTGTVSSGGEDGVRLSNALPNADVVVKANGGDVTIVGTADATSGNGVVLTAPNTSATISSTSGNVSITTSGGVSKTVVDDYNVNGTLSINTGKGTDGIIDISPFTCMNGIICEAVYPSVSAAHDELPIRLFYFDGIGANIDRDVEIFLDLARAYQRRKERSRIYPEYFG